MRPVLASLAPILAALALLSAACGSGGPSDADVLISLADEVAVPAFQAVAEDMARLDEATQSVCQNPDDSILGGRPTSVVRRPRILDGIGGDVVRTGDGEAFPQPAGLVAY